MKCKVPINTDSFLIVPNQFIPTPYKKDEFVFKKYTKKHIINSTNIDYIIKVLIFQLKRFIKNI